MALCLFTTQHESGGDYQTVVYPYTVKYSQSFVLFLMSFHRWTEFRGQNLEAMAQMGNSIQRSKSQTKMAVAGNSLVCAGKVLVTVFAVTVLSNFSSLVET